VAIVALGLTVVPMILLILKDAEERGRYEQPPSPEGWPD
jgi:hypothetical protein